MLESLAPYAVAAILALVAGGVGWRQIKRHGREKALRRVAERRADAAEAEIEMGARAPLSGSQSVAVLRRIGRVRSWWRRGR